MKLSRAASLTIAMMLSCTGSVTNTSTQRSEGTPSPAASVVIAEHLASAPSDCPNSRPLLQSEDPWGSVFGSMPAFGAFYARAVPSTGSFHTGKGNVRKTSNGWTIKVLWLLQAGTTFTPTLSGAEVGTGWPITFNPSNGSPSTTMPLDPNHPGTPSHEAGWSEYPSSMSFPEAGCYQIEASWGGGSWQRGFGFGE